MKKRSKPPVRREYPVAVWVTEVPPTKAELQAMDNERRAREVQRFEVIAEELFRAVEEMRKEFDELRYAACDLAGCDIYDWSDAYIWRYTELATDYFKEHYVSD